MMKGPIVCRRCAVISRGITGHCTCVTQLLAQKDREIKRLQKKASDLNEVLSPFVLHGLALEALTRDDQNSVISKVGASRLVLGAYRMLLESVDKKEFRCLRLAEK
jgi:hypothetical protein